MLPEVHSTEGHQLRDQLCLQSSQEQAGECECLTPVHPRDRSLIPRTRVTWEWDISTYSAELGIHLMPVQITKSKRKDYIIYPLILLIYSLFCHFTKFPVIRYTWKFKKTLSCFTTQGKIVECVHCGCRGCSGWVHERLTAVELQEHTLVDSFSLSSSQWLTGCELHCI